MHGHCNDDSVLRSKCGDLDFASDPCRSKRVTGASLVLAARVAGKTAEICKMIGGRKRC